MKILGKNLILYQNGVPVAGAKTCELDIACDTLEVSSANAGAWRNFIAGRKEWSITCGFLVGYDRDPATFLNVGNTFELWIRHPFEASDSKYFGGIYTGTVVEYYATDPDEIYYSTQEGRFVAKKGDYYYINWTGETPSGRPTSNTTPEVGVAYITSDYNIYYWTGEEMYHCLTLKGSSILTRCRITASVGGIAQGSFQFKGTGDLISSAS